MNPVILSGIILPQSLVPPAFHHLMQCYCTMLKTFILMASANALATIQANNNYKNSHWTEKF